MPYVRNKSISVVMTKDPTSPGGVNFALNENEGNGPAQKAIFHNKKHPGLVVYFNIRDPDDTGLLFRPDPADAMWVAPPGKLCPTSPSTWEGFIPLSVEKDGDGRNTQLIAYFRNLKQQSCQFALRFLWPDGTGIDYDPIGDGQNGLRR